MSDFTIRTATPADAATIVSLIRDLADFERLSQHVKITPADVKRDLGRYFEALLAERDREAVGLALFFHSYSTFEGRPSLYLEDLFVSEKARGLGLGRRLLAATAAVARDRGARRLDLMVLDWNPARDVYAHLGFTASEDWLPYRLTGEALERLASEAP